MWRSRSVASALTRTSFRDVRSPWMCVQTRSSDSRRSRTPVCVHRCARRLMCSRFPTADTVLRSSSQSTHSTMDPCSCVRNSVQSGGLRRYREHRLGGATYALWAWLCPAQWPFLSTASRHQISYTHSSDASGMRLLSSLGCLSCSQTACR